MPVRSLFAVLVPFLSAGGLPGCGPPDAVPPASVTPVDLAFENLVFKLNDGDLLKGEVSVESRSECRIEGRFRTTGCRPPTTLYITFIDERDGKEVRHGGAGIGVGGRLNPFEYVENLRVPSRSGRYELRVEAMKSERYLKDCPKLTTGVVSRGYVTVVPPTD